MNAHQQDLVERMAPSEHQVAVAEVALVDPQVDGAITPIVFPRKSYGLWQAGTPVEHPGGIWTYGSGVTYHTAVAAAEEAARAALGSRDGTYGWVHFSRKGGDWSVFEAPGSRS